MTTQVASGWVPEPPPPPDTSAFSGRLRLLRMALDLTTEEMARRLSVPPTTYRSWEAGREPRKQPQLVTKLSTMFGVDWFWMIGEMGPEQGIPASRWKVASGGVVIDMLPRLEPSVTGDNGGGNLAEVVGL